MQPTAVSYKGLQSQHCSSEMLQFQNHLPFEKPSWTLQAFGQNHVKDLSVKTGLGQLLTAN